MLAAHIILFIRVVLVIQVILFAQVNSKQFYLSVENVTIAPDGYQRYVLTFNGTVPGKLLSSPPPPGPQGSSPALIPMC